MLSPLPTGLLTLPAPRAVPVALLIAVLAVPAVPAVATVATAPLAQDTASARAWQQLEPYIAPDFEAYFPDDAEGGRLLDEHFDANTLRGLDDEQFLAVIRAGLRRTSKHRTTLLSSVGNRCIWGQEPQHPDAIELCYHAADFREQAQRYGCRHYAVYFGLSVVTRKTPAILRTLAELCVAIDDPNDIGRVAWGAETQLDELLPWLQPQLTSDDPYERAKAESVRAIFTGELGAFEWAAERARQPPRPKQGKPMPDVRDVLRSGDSAARLALLARISDDELTKDMDDSYLADFAAAAEDPDPAVRAELARVVCAAWIWRAGLHRISDPAVDLALRLSRDPDPDVRSQAVYHGLSTYRGERDDVLRRLVELALDPGEDAMHGRINWALERYEDRLASLLEADLRGDDRPRAHAVYALYRSVLKRRPPVIPDGIAGPADLLGTWRVTVESNGNPNLSVPPLTVVQDEHGALRLQRDNGEELGLDALAELLYAELGAVLNFSFHTQVEGTLLRSTGRLEGDRIQGSSRWDGGETLIIWSAQRLPE